MTDYIHLLTDTTIAVVNGLTFEFLSIKSSVID